MTGIASSSRPIADYAMLSDCHSAALVSGEGSIDWLCLPRFDSPSIFGRLLDPAAGHWSIRPVGDFESRRRYLPGSLVLETQFETPDGMVMVTDALVFGTKERAHRIGEESSHLVVRVIECTKGRVALDVEMAPRSEYGLVRPRMEVIDGGVRSVGGPDGLCLSGPAPSVVDQASARWRLDLRAGEKASFSLRFTHSWDLPPSPIKAKDIERHLADTEAAWTSWSELHESYQGPWKDLVHQSGRVLRALTYQPTGALVAAPTTSLPEEIGGSRNWDYRYSWIRGAGPTMNALWVAACPDEANRLLAWMIRAAGTSSHQEHGLQVVYGVGGEHDLSERILAHLQGWASSAPVRVGNDAWYQHRIDVFGPLLDAVYRLRSQMGAFGASTVEFLAGLADAAAAAWHDPDQGVWEIRGDPQHFVSSKLMCWLALDRAVRIFEDLDLAEVVGIARLAGWGLVGEEIRRTILERGWNPAVGAFTQSYGSSVVDASVLMLAITGFLPATDPQMATTIERVALDLAAPCGLIHRYVADDAEGGREATFVVCTYWLVECLALAGQVDRASELFERVTAYANDVGLLGEVIDPIKGDILGNFPHAFSHVGLVNAAWAIAAAGEDGDR